MATRRTIPPGAPSPTVSSERGHTATTRGYVTPRHFTTSDPRVAWEHFRPLAQRVDATGLAHFRNDPYVAMHNIHVGLAAVTPLFETLSQKAPEISQAELMETPALALALSYAAGRSPSVKKFSKHEIAARVSAIAAPRELTLSYLRIVSRLEPDSIPSQRVASVGARKGPLAMASDCVQIAGVFHECAEVLTKRHPFSDEYLKAMTDDAAWLLAALKPGNVAKLVTPRTPESVERDQYARLLDERHDALRTAAVVLFGIRNADAKVPPLYSVTRDAAVEVDEPDVPVEPIG